MSQRRGLINLEANALASPKAVRRPQPGGHVSTGVTVKNSNLRSALGRVSSAQLTRARDSRAATAPAGRRRGQRGGALLALLGCSRCGDADRAWRHASLLLAT